MRGATNRVSLCRTYLRHFNPRTPCGVLLRIQGRITHVRKFQSTHPLRGATLVVGGGGMGISIHAPLAGCYFSINFFKNILRDFNPRTPCGVLRIYIRSSFYEHKFQSTHPLRGATFVRGNQLAVVIISIHAPLAGCYNCSNQNSICSRISIHAPLAGCYALYPVGSFYYTIISIHAPLAGCYTATITPSEASIISIHAPLAGCYHLRPQNLR